MLERARLWDLAFFWSEIFGTISWSSNVCLVAVDFVQCARVAFAFFTFDSDSVTVKLETWNRRWFDSRNRRHSQRRVGHLSQLTINKFGNFENDNDDDKRKYNTAALQCIGAALATCLGTNLLRLSIDN